MNCYLDISKLEFCLVDSQVKRDENVIFKICVFLKILFFNTIDTSIFSIPFVPICITFFSFQLNLNSIDWIELARSLV